MYPSALICWRGIWTRNAYVAHTIKYIICIRSVCWTLNLKNSKEKCYCMFMLLVVLLCHFLLIPVLGLRSPFSFKEVAFSCNNSKLISAVMNTWLWPPFCSFVVSLSAALLCPTLSYIPGALLFLLQDFTGLLPCVWAIVLYCVAQPCLSGRYSSV